MRPEPPVLETRGLTKRVGDRVVVARVDLAVARREIVALTGPSGTGKTTFLRLLNRLDEPTEGTVLLHGRDYRDVTPRVLRHRVGLVTGDGALVDGTVAGNVTLGPRLRGEEVPPKEVDGLLDALGLTGLAARDAADLSRGEAQRVALARGLLNRPDALLLDEPTANLDAEAVRRVEDVITARVRDADLACVWVTHDPEQARRVADRVLRLKDGRLTRNGGDAA